MMMRLFMSFFVYFAYYIQCFSQSIINPVFDRTDDASFHLDSVKLEKDITEIFCSYYAEDSSWVNISPTSFLEDIETKEKYPLLKTYGIPISPQKRHFADAEKISVILYFPRISSRYFNLIESTDNDAFNIYGINLNETRNHYYSMSDYVESFKLVEQDEDSLPNNDTAIEHRMKQLDAAQFYYGSKSELSAHIMYELSLLHFDNKYYSEAYGLAVEIVEILSKLNLSEEGKKLLALSYGSLGTYLELSQHYKEAIEYMEKSLAIRRDVGETGALNYGEYIMHMARVYYYDDNFPKALLYGKEGLKIYENWYQSDNYKYCCIYANVLSNACIFYLEMNQVDEAIKCSEKALEIIEKNGVCENHVYINALYNYSVALSSNGESEKSKKILTLIPIDLLDMPNDIQLYGSIVLARTLFALEDGGDFAKAIEELEKLLNVLDEYKKQGHPNYPLHLNVLKRLYGLDPLHNVKYLEQSLNLQKEMTGEESVAYGNLLLKYISRTWIETLHHEKDVDPLLNRIEQVSSILKNHYNSIVYNLGNQKKEEYWHRYQGFFNWFIPSVSALVNTRKSSSLAYDASLFYKGAKLESANEIMNLISASDDETLARDYKDYKQNTTNYSLEAMSLKDSLKHVVDEKEYLIFKKLSQDNSYYKGTNYSWQDVKKQLKEGEIALEIVSYESLKKDDVYYDAYVLSKTKDSPFFVPLFSESELKPLLERDSIDYNALGSLLWRNLLSTGILEKVSKIYFSPSGILHFLGIEYLPINDNLNMGDKYEICRLSSTRVLCQRKDSVELMKAALFGGLTYDSEQDNVINNIGSSVVNSDSYRSFQNSIMQRSGFDQLTGSKMEVDSIFPVLNDNNIDVELYCDKSGSEKAFKNLSNKFYNIIHVATHGMFVDKSEAEKKSEELNIDFFMLNDEKEESVCEDLSLLRSFLVMSGGNKLPGHKHIRLDEEDDILTALEISQLDFRGLDLLVLSACQTGLGDVDSEGVYGLQRGFKLAGANTILMSLGKVDDEATRILMVEFYRNLMSGKSKQQSLKDAQKYLRQAENGKYDDPKYWASFIMLDGIN